MDNNINKKSITIFFCDVYGTVDGTFTDDDCKLFAELLKKLKDKNNSDYLFFSMSSTEHPEVVSYYEKFFSKYFSEDIIVKKNTHDVEAIREAKISCALLYLQNLTKEYNIDAVYCADDIELLQELFTHLLGDVMGIHLNTIIPKKDENRLEFINQEIERRFISTSKLK